MSLARNIAAYGLGSHCLALRASEVPVLDLERPGSDARRRISGEIADVVAQDGAGAIVPGCAGMVDLAASLAVEHGLPVIDRAAAACGFAETLVRMRAVPGAD